MRVLRVHTGHSKHSLPTTQETTTRGHHPSGQYFRFIVFFAAKDRETLYSQQKQDQEQTMAQIMNSLLQSSHQIKESRESH